MLWDWLSLPAVQAVIGVTVVLAAVFMGIRIILALRPATSTADKCESDLVHNFKEMHLGGDINEEEFRSIQKVLGKSRNGESDS